MYKLEDLTEGQDVDIEDLLATQEPTVKVVSKSSNLNLAVNAAALSTDPTTAIQAYREGSAEMDVNGYSTRIDGLVKAAQQRTYSQSVTALTPVLTDPTIGDENKLTVITSLQDRENQAYSVMNMVSTEAILSPSGKDESVRMEEQRTAMADKIIAVNQVKKETQAILNREMLKDDSTTAGLVLDFFQTIIPQYNNVIGAKISVEADEEDSNTAQVAQAITLLGESKMDMRKLIENTRPEDRLAITQKLVDIINSNSSIVMSDSNEFARKDYLSSVIDQGGYGEVGRWVDNVVSVLDLVGIGSLLSAPIRGAKVATAAGKASNVVRRSVKSRVQPTTLSQNLKDTNPEKARGAHIAMSMDESDEAASALYGSTRADALANDLLAEIGNPDGSVINKVSSPDRMLDMPANISDEVLDFARNDGSIFAFEAEKAAARAHVVSKLNDVTNLKTRTEMTTITSTGDGVKASVVYGPTDGGFETAETALNMAEFALKDLGVDQSKIKLMVRDGDSYKELSVDEFNALNTKDVIRGGPSGITRQEKDFLVKVDYDYTYSPFDVAPFKQTTTKLNLFDRVGVFTGGSKQGSLDAMIFDAASRLDPIISKSAVYAENRAAGIEKQIYKMAKDFSKQFLGVKKEAREVMTKLILEANEQGIEHSYTQMRAAGLGDKEIHAMSSWRKTWDTIYHLENADAAKSLKRDGFMQFVDRSSDSNLIAKPVGRNGAPTRVYDTTTDTVVNLTKEQLDELYEVGGSVAKLRQPLLIADEGIEAVLVKNTSGDNFLKAINEDTKVLNYRKGYYSVHYKDPYFIRRKIKDGQGNVIKEETFATAATKRQAETLAKARAQQEGLVYGDDVYFSEDLKKAAFTSDDHMSLNSARGRSAQKLRGKRLEQADTNVVDPRQTNILDPIESLTATARSLSKRTAYRDMLDTTKTRALKQFKEYYPTDKYGRPTWPTSNDQVAYRGGHLKDSKKLADARTLYEYVRSLEDGYINTIDDSLKAMYNSIADIVGGIGLERTEKAFAWAASARGPSSISKNVAFQLYLALNPIRQFIIQGWQATQLFAINPQWFLKGRMTPQLTAFMYRQLSGSKIPEFMLKGTGWSPKMAEDAFKSFEKGGHLAAIDRSNLVRGALVDIADQMNNATSLAGKVGKYAMAPVNFSRKIGFDAGESVNKMTAFLSHYDQALVAGKDVSKSDVVADISAKAENFIYNMNAGGDMPYNTNTLASLFQFMQVPHKALLTMTTNRALSKTEKAKLAGMNMTLYGMPASATIAWFGEDGLDVLPKDQNAREAALQGLVGTTFNKMASLLTEEDASVDWSGLAPMDAYGSMEFVHSMFTTDIGTLVTESPSGQLFWGNNPRVTNWLKTAGRYTNLLDDYQDPTTFGMVAMEFVRMGSGMSNAYKAAYALEYEKKVGQYGQLPGQNVPTPNAIAVAFGFESLEDARRRSVTEEVYQKSESAEKDMKEYVAQLYKHLGAKNPGDTDADIYIKAVNEAWRVWRNGNAGARKALDKELRTRLTNKDSRLHQRVVEAWYLTPEERKSAALRMNFDTEEQRQKYIEVLEYMDKYREEK